MPRFLTPEWVAGFNAALEGAELPAPGPDAGLAAADGRFTVAQEVRGTPDGDVRLVLRAAGGSLVLEVGPLDGSDAESDATISLAYDDAVAMAKGHLTAALALTLGKVRVRGDLSVLVAAQEMLHAARAHARTFEAGTTY